MRPIQEAITVLALLASTLHLSAQDAGSTVCVAPSAAEKPQTCAPGLCASGPLSVKIDRRSIIEWPKAESLRIDQLQRNERHRVIIYRAGKPQQSFTFRFSTYKSPKLCLFLNDMYWTAMLWEATQAPWCKCR